MSTGLLVACSSGEPEPSAADRSAVDSATAPGDSIAAAKAENRSRHVDERFGDRPRVLAGEDRSGLESSRLFFDKSETAVVVAGAEPQRLRAVSLSMTAHAPVLGLTEDNAEQVKKELDRLGATTVLAVGEVRIPEVPAEMTIVRDPGGDEALSALTSLHFEKAPVPAPGAMAKSVADFTPSEPAELTAEWLPEAGAVASEKKSPEEKKETGSFPVQSARDGASAPVVVASPQSPILDVANARAYGAQVRMMDYPDPRISEEATKMVAGLEDRPVVALGVGFGTGEQLAEKISLAQNVTEHLPGGGTMVFPGRRMIALYGHPSGGALGVMGERTPEESVAYVRDLVDQYQALNPAEPVIPAFEIIATVASEFPGEDGDYSNEAAPEELLPYVDAILEAGGYAVLDLQPGRANFLDQAKRYEELLKRPNVGLALDPEWRIGPDEQPLTRVGSVEASEVNETADWLAKLTRDNNLPQKTFVLHQFQLQMLRDREQIRTDHPELAYVLHADGHGVAEEKFDTWNVMRQDLGPGWFMAWKNFFDEDAPMFTPEQTYAVEPRPWFVSYQ
ncbi:MBL fold metallo-hydrolase [Corynebacterium sp. zg331]|uniref:MBL fold metallo-hydrolase n=1 Tax=unclassified Corynebacterium TaxID=2624378 RepID=UPI00128C8EAE|nr:MULTISPECIES: MBL fold metallo-hydrolase [unclassified Corynebacterium]MPV52735.1 MBL fold metallo-hydrolase [Corynebacterium sp. zg331]